MGIGPSQAAIKDAFRTPEVIRMFAQKEPGQLRLRLQSLQEQLRLGRIAPRAFTCVALLGHSVLRTVAASASSVLAPGFVVSPPAEKKPSR